MSAYAEARKRTAEKMGDDYGRDLACMACGTLTPCATLSDFGTRCFPCYAAYCRDVPPPPERSEAALRIRAEIAAMGKRLPR